MGMTYDQIVQMGKEQRAAQGLSETPDYGDYLVANVTNAYKAGNYSSDETGYNAYMRDITNATNEKSKWDAQQEQNNINNSNTAKTEESNTINHYYNLYKTDPNKYSAQDFYAQTGWTIDQYEKKLQSPTNNALSQIVNAMKTPSDYRNYQKELAEIQRLNRYDNPTAPNSPAISEYQYYGTSNPNISDKKPNYDELEKKWHENNA